MPSKPSLQNSAKTKFNFTAVVETASLLAIMTTGVIASLAFIFEYVLRSSISLNILRFFIAVGTVADIIFAYKKPIFSNLVGANFSLSTKIAWVITLFLTAIIVTVLGFVEPDKLVLILGRY